jgi:hypothetical protein
MTTVTSVTISAGPGAGSTADQRAPARQLVPTSAGNRRPGGRHRRAGQERGAKPRRSSQLPDVGAVAVDPDAAAAADPDPAPAVEPFDSHDPIDDSLLPLA